MASDDELASGLPPAQPPPLTKPAPAGTEPAKESFMDETFASLRAAIPTKFIPDNLAQYMVRQSRLRLELAQISGIELGELSIGDDGLPTWPSLFWDPETESLHTAIQNRLIDYQVSQDLGDLVLSQVVTKGNMKLSQARELGIDIQDLSIGLNLLPTWCQVQDDAENELPVLEDVDMTESDTAASRPDESMSTLASFSPITPFTDVFDSHPASQPLASNMPSTTGLESDSGSSDESEYDDTIELNNGLSAVPEYEDGEPVNIVHDVQLVGGPGGVTEVDLEVWLLEDDDADDLPEVELAVDREALEGFDMQDEIVDIEVPGMELFCFDGFEEAASEAGDVPEPMEDLTSADEHDEATIDDDAPTSLQNSSPGSSQSSRDVSLGLDSSE